MDLPACVADRVARLARSLSSAWLQGNHVVVGKEVSHLEAESGDDILGGTARVARHQHAIIVAESNAQTGVLVIVCRALGTPLAVTRCSRPTGESFQRLNADI